MLSLSGSVVVNVGAEYIETYLRNHGHHRTQAEKGQQVEFWVDKLISTCQLDVDEFENFLFQELFYGKRKLMRVYDFDVLNVNRSANVWLEGLKQQFDIPSLSFTNILGIGVSHNNKLRIASIRSEKNYKGDLTKVEILFVHYAETFKITVNETRSYIPASIDFECGKITLKSWNRNSLIDDYKPNQLMDKIFTLLNTTFGTFAISKQYQRRKALFAMSQGIVNNIYKQIPAFNQVEKLSDSIITFEQSVLSVLELVHKDQEGNDYSLSKNVFDFHDEICKMLERLAVSDFFYNVPYEDMWKMGINTIMAKIRFNDVEHVLTTLSGEESVMPIFCTKTFMALKKPLEDTKLVERLWIVTKRDAGFVRIRYDATNEPYLEIIVLSNIRFNEDDMKLIMEIFEKYETEIPNEITNNYIRLTG